MHKESYGEEPLFEEFVIRDIAEHDSLKGYVAGYIPKTIVLINTLDADIDITVYGCRKGNGTIFQVNSIPFIIKATENDFITLNDYFPCIFLKAKAQTIPTTGDLSAYLLKVA